MLIACALEEWDRPLERQLAVRNGWHYIYFRDRYIDITPFKPLVVGLS